MARPRKKPAAEADALRPLADRLGESDKLRPGTIALRFRDGGSAFLHSSRGKVEVGDAPSGDEPPLVEIFGDRKRIQAIIDGEKDPRAQFLAGGLRVRGDLGYLSDLVVDIGLLDEPF